MFAKTYQPTVFEVNSTEKKKKKEKYNVHFQLENRFVFLQLTEWESCDSGMNQNVLTNLHCEPFRLGSLLF